MTELPRPLPVKTPTTAPFWDGLAQRRIVIQYSPSTGEYVFYPRVRAPRTLADDLQWREISGRGVLYAFTVARRPVGPHFADAVPHLLAIVEWEEGPRFSTEMVNVAPGDLRVGMPVRPVFIDHPEGDVTMLRYEPAETPGGHGRGRVSNARRPPRRS
ncbi:OB-fold domain-containing protein [Mycolicibacillus parakoreensis]|uniref:OB-fold domain-containing protein n=1 Tax=Mycolicibacillus parakoreensis TaxID=1069221 RepID=A0ABY3U482_9MYCO|nr:OB-fold domain-containing protein [Mycolicibacillus parakoreensis]MCV7316566.1 OB-fold domain-containing protein [Mycolicibacillus parakoreensis]ULN54758.1 OB-fold domain-containing protein [Mycolicibacillus parakoreensis]